MDDLLAHSKKRHDHLAHLKEIFARCRFYNIRLNPHKCVFMVESRHLLGFIVSKHRIRVDPDKVKAIVEFLAPQSILQPQRLQGKAKFLRRFIVNYDEMTKGFMRLLKKGILYLWDDQAQRSFDALKNALVSAPLLNAPDYSHDFLLYLVASLSSLGMVLVQVHSDDSEHVI